MIVLLAQVCHPLIIALGDPLLPDTTHFLPCTITDTAFFRGHNKAIQQGNQHWLINTSHGAIYYLADYGVVKVAQIENFQNYPAALLQRRLFIEDRDKGELIFFSRLNRTDREGIFHYSGWRYGFLLLWPFGKKVLCAHQSDINKS